jgi:xanthosine utilization system XapX-like protein
MFEGESRYIESQKESETLPGRTASPGAKFAIGLLAGVSAVLLPRVLALVSQGDELQIVFLPAPYFLLALGAGLFIGLVMLVFEYGVPAKPRETFMAALGIPAILTGALGTASTAASVKDLAAEATQLRQAVAQDQGIGKAGAFSDLQPIGAPAAAPKLPGKTSFFPLFIAVAHAADAGAAQDTPVRFGVRVEQRQYVVVLKQAASEAEALQAAQSLRKQIPTAQAVRANNNYFVVLGGAPSGETDALLAATRAKRTLGEKVQPVLVEVRQ